MAPIKLQLQSFNYVETNVGLLKTLVQKSREYDIIALMSVLYEEGYCMRLAICDDDAREQRQLLRIIQDRDQTCNAECFSDGASLLRAAESAPPFDIAFLDIYMPSENGVDIAGTLREISPKTGIVFVTTSQDHAVNAFSLAALHYLVKPVSAGDVAEAFRRLEELRPHRRKFVSFPGRHGVQTVFLDQVCSLTSINHAVEISLVDGRQIKVWMPLNEIMQKLGKNFLKINRGIVVNMDCIEQMGTDRCVLLDGKEFFLAVRERSAICAAYNDYRLEQLSRQNGFGGMGP